MATAAAAAIPASFMLPCLIQAEDFGPGGLAFDYWTINGASYVGYPYRSDDVVIETCSDVGGGWALTRMEAVQWTAYAVTSPADAVYDLTFRVASSDTGWKGWRVGLDNRLLTGMGYSAPQGWHDETLRGVTLSAGVHRLVFNSTSNSHALNFINVSLVATVNPAFTPTATGTPTPAYWPLPGRVEAENARLGAEGVAYHDTTAGNCGGYWRIDNVDVEPSGDTDGGYSIGYAAPGEWLTYGVEPAQAGVYRVTLRGAAMLTYTVGVDLAFPGCDAAFTYRLDAGWQTYQTVDLGGVTLQAGRQVMTLTFLRGATNLNWLDFSLERTFTPTPGASPTALGQTPRAGARVFPRPVFPGRPPYDTARFLLPETHDAGTLRIFDLGRREVRRLDFGAGAEVAWDARDAGGAVVRAGEYLYLVRAGGLEWRGSLAVAR